MQAGQFKREPRARSAIVEKVGFSPRDLCERQAFNGDSVGFWRAIAEVPAAPAVLDIIVCSPDNNWFSILSIPWVFGPRGM